MHSGWLGAATLPQLHTHGAQNFLCCNNCDEYSNCMKVFVLLCTFNSNFVELENLQLFLFYFLAISMFVFVL